MTTARAERSISYTSRFRRDYKQAKKSPQFRQIDPDLELVLTALVRDAPLPSRNRDHPLNGEWKDFRDCHVRPDLVLIYRKLDPATLELVRLGTHSDLRI